MVKNKNQKVLFFHKKNIKSIANELGERDTHPKGEGVATTQTLLGLKLLHKEGHT